MITRVLAFITEHPADIVASVVVAAWVLFVYWLFNREYSR